MNLKKVMDLIKLMEEKGIIEAEISGFFTKIRLKRASSTGIAEPSGEGAGIVAEIPPKPVRIAAEAPEPKPAATESPAGEVTEQAEKEEKEEIDESNLTPIKAPMVGTFYRAPAPGAPPYIEVGQVISQGDVVCIIEAMKLMNEIESEVSGRVRKILVENAQPVEYGQVLVLVEEFR